MALHGKKEEGPLAPSPFVIWRFGQKSSPTQRHDFLQRNLAAQGSGGALGLKLHQTHGIIFLLLRQKNSFRGLAIKLEADM